LDLLEDFESTFGWPLSPDELTQDLDTVAAWVDRIDEQVRRTDYDPGRE
jgi:hypothetical protein